MAEIRCEETGNGKGSGDNWQSNVLLVLLYDFWGARRGEDLRSYGPRATGGHRIRNSIPSVSLRFTDQLLGVNAGGPCIYTSL